MVKRCERWFEEQKVLCVKFFFLPERLQLKIFFVVIRLNKREREQTLEVCKFAAFNWKELSCGEVEIIRISMRNVKERWVRRHLLSFARKKIMTQADSSHDEPNMKKISSSTVIENACLRKAGSKHRALRILIEPLHKLIPYSCYDTISRTNICGYLSSGQFVSIRQSV